MNKFWNFLKNNWLVVVIVVIVLFAVVGGPLLINQAFSEPAWCDFFAVDWEAKDALAYYGSALGFVGTVVLGAIAVYQTKKAHEQTDTANQLATDALAQTQQANELAAKMQKLEESRFLSIVSVERVRYETVNATDTSNAKTPFMFPHTPKVSLIDLTAGSNPSKCYIIDTVIKNSSDFHIRTLSAMANYLGKTWRMPPKRNGIAPESEMSARIIIPFTHQKPTSNYNLEIHIYFTNIFEYTTHLTLAIEDITNTNGKYSYNFDVEKESKEMH